MGNFGGRSDVKRPVQCQTPSLMSTYQILHPARLKAAPAFLVLVTNRHPTTSTTYYFIPHSPQKWQLTESYPRRMASYQFIPKRVWFGKDSLVRGMN